LPGRQSPCCHPVVLERDAGQFVPARLGHQSGQHVRRGVTGQAASVDVGDAVALRIPPPDPRLVDQVDPRAVGDTQSGPFADQGCDLVPEGDARLGGDDDRCDRPSWQAFSKGTA